MFETWEFPLFGILDQEAKSNNALVRNQGLAQNSDSNKSEEHKNEPEGIVINKNVSDRIKEQPKNSCIIS